MKTQILTSHKLLEKIERELRSARVASAAQTLGGVLELLREQRRFERTALYAAVASDAVMISQAAPESWAAEREVAIAVRMGARTVGELRVATDRELSYADDVLLRRLARSLGRFLTSTGKVLVRRAREAQAEAAEQSPGKVQPASDRERGAQTHKAAAGAAARR